MKTASVRGRRRALAIAIALCNGLGAAGAWGESEVEEVVVTGSRIKSASVYAPQPVSTITSETIVQSGQPDITEILNDNPALLSSVSSSNSIDAPASNVGDVGAVGGASLNLRGLGIERTLTVVNGRRHVAGIEGTSAVDVGTIPRALIDRVEVLTGGSSAIYGADAVTGVVNFVLKDDFEGVQFDFQPGISGETDNESYSLSAVFGKNFANGRGNVTVALQYDYDDGLKQGDRSFFKEDGVWNDDVNPALRFQNGDIEAGATPNFARYYNFDNTGLFPVGLRVPTAAENFATQYEGAFGEAPELTAGELAIINRAASAPPRVFLPGRTFNITSPFGVVALGDFGTAIPLGAEPDLDGNGTSDCLQSFTGYNSSLDGAGSFGAAGGCWFINESGAVTPYEDGLVAGNFNQFGASQSYIAPETPYVLPQYERYSINVNGHYTFDPRAEVFWETKYVYGEWESDGGGFNFTDLLYGAPDNPFLPEALRPFIDEANGVGFVGPGGLYMSRDSDDWGDNTTTTERETYRLVGGLRGAFEETGLDYEISANYGKFTRNVIDRNDMIADRFFAAIDAVTDPATGEAVCRSDLDPTAYPRTTPFDIFSFVGGGVRSSFFTFTPGDGQCKPMNIWGGQGAMSQASIDFVTRDRLISEDIEQTVLQAIVSGDSSRFFSLPAGPIGFAVGFEYREEKTAQDFDRFDRGILPVSGVTSEGVAFSAGDFVGDVSNAGSLGEDPSITLLSGASDYDTTDYFAEISVPLLANLPGAQELTASGSFRRSDYSTFGENDTYGYGLVWQPIEDVRFRGSFSRAVRVPNLFELFSPAQGAFFRPADPCDATQIATAPDPALRQTNCVADLRANNVSDAELFAADGTYAFQDPLSAGFPGTTGGNSALTEEVADTVTYGVVLQPRFVPGLTLTVDYWDIEIEDAIVAISSQNIVNGCYDSPSLNNAFCPLISRNPAADSAQNGGLTSLNQTRLNFGAVEAEGYDLGALYQFEVLGVGVDLSMNATRQDQLDLIEPASPGEPPVVNPELGEMRRPEWASQFGVGLSYGPYSLSWSGVYYDEMTLGYEDGGEIETIEQNYGGAGVADARLIQDIRGAWQASDAVTVYGGVSNLTNRQPYVSEFGYPVSPRGAYFFMGVTYNGAAR
ncbi:MAG: hypothetical protein RLZZ174_1198 [Pseudomonadota bacterium]